MEKEGLKRCLDLLDSNGLVVDYIVTDHHPQIEKYLRERNITQYYDVWHFEKGMCSSLYMSVCLIDIFFIHFVCFVAVTDRTSVLIINLLHIYTLYQGCQRNSTNFPKTRTVWC